MYPPGASPQEVPDLVGNVWEWCLYERPHARDAGLRARDQRDGPRRVVRGGSWDDARGGARCAYRDFVRPVGRSSFIGFRVVRGSSIP